MDEGKEPNPPRRTVRPNFAESVYGDKSAGVEDASGEYSESSLAHRRQVSVLKLKQPPLGNAPQADPAPPCPEPPPEVDLADQDLQFSYTDCDTLAAELAELYSYSELDDFGSNFECWRIYADKMQIEPPYVYSSLPEAKKQAIWQDLCFRTECAQPHERLTTLRIMLYLLQGSFADFADEDDMEAGVPSKPIVDKGTGGYEQDCLKQAFYNAHTAYASGAFQALCVVLLAEISHPFDDRCPWDGRDSKASSRDSRHASNADLSDHERRRRAATLEDNESLRVVLSAIYHMVELIRNDELTSEETDPKYATHRLDFALELDEPLDNYGKPLLYILFEMMPAFYTGIAPHYPMKKVLLLVWKVLLMILGGREKLAQLKIIKRAAMNLTLMENTIEVAENMPATVITDGECGIRMAAKRSRHGSLALARQHACSNSEEGKDDEQFSDSGDMPKPGDTPSKPNVDFYQRSDRQVSGDRTPRAGSPMPKEVVKKGLLWKSKISKAELESYIQAERLKFFEYKLPGDTTTMFGLPPPIVRSIDVLKKHLYVSMAEIQAENDQNLNRFLFSSKEEIEENSTEKLYRLLLPNLSQYIVALLKVLLAAAPSSKAKSDALNILVDVLTPEMDGSDVLSNSISLDHSSSPLEESVRLAIDINRHKEIMVKAASSILILLCKHLKLNHVHQFEYLCQQIVFGNGIPLLLKFLDTQMMRYVQSRHEIHAYNYPQCVLHYVRNREEWPVLNPDNVEENLVTESDGVYYMWRNVFSAINIVRVLNKLVKGKQSRVMMLLVFKSAPILKRSLRLRLGIFQLYVLKALKMQARYLGRQWRKTNMDVMSAIYSKVRHRLTDDWAYANEIRKSYDYHGEEKDLKADVERFHSRRYAKYYPNFAIEVSDAPMPGDDYLNRVDLREYEPVDSCFHSVLGCDPELSENFKKNYSKWVDQEVLRRNIDWEKLLINTRGIYNH